MRNRPPKRKPFRNKSLIRTAKFRWQEDPGDYWMHLIGRKFVQFIRDEIQADYRRRGWSASRRITNSISYVVREGNEAIEIYSTIPNIQQIIEGAKPYRMTWIKRSNKRPIIPIWDRKSKQVRFRYAPETSRWVHPGVRRMLFMERARKRIRKWIASVAFLAAYRRTS